MVSSLISLVPGSGSGSGAGDGGGGIQQKVNELLSAGLVGFDQMSEKYPIKLPSMPSLPLRKRSPIDAATVVTSEVKDGFNKVISPGLIAAAYMEEVPGLVSHFAKRSGRGVYR